MKRIGFGFFVYLWLIPGIPTACDCEGGRFLHAVKGADLVVRVEAIEYGPKLYVSPEVDAYVWLNVRIVEVLKGEVESEVMTLLGDDGFSCRLYVSENVFPIKAQFVFALGNGLEGPRAISSCGEHVVRYEPTTHTVRGIGGFPDTLSYDELRLLLKDTKDD